MALADAERNLAFSEKELFVIFSNKDNNTPKFKSNTEKDYTNAFKEQLPDEFKCCHSYEELLLPHIRKYKRKKQGASRKPVSTIVNEASWRTKILHISSHQNFPGHVSLSGDGPSEPKKTKGPETFTTSFSRSYKDFKDMSEKHKKIITQPLIDALDTFLDTSDFSLSKNQLIGYLLMRENAGSTKEFPYISGNSLFASAATTEIPNVKNHFTDLEAVSLMHALNLSKQDMRCVRQFLWLKGISFPTTNQLLDCRKQLRPESNAVLGDKGRAVDYETLVEVTIKSILSVVAENSKEVPKNGKLYLKDGCDGAGSMPKLKSSKTVQDQEHIFQYGFIPLKLVEKDEHSGEEVMRWENPAMNAPNTFRSLYTIREKENDESLLKLVIKSTDSVRNKLNKEGITIVVNGANIHFDVDIKDTMKDLKFKKMVSGLGGADCLLCKSKQAEWTNLALIEADESFKINRSAADTRQIFNSVVDDNGNIRTKPYDFDVRSGVTREPISNSDQHSITITHSYINGCSWFLKLLYRCYMNLEVWPEKGGHESSLQKAKDAVRSVIQNATGLRLDYVNSVCGKGGTSTDGKQARRFFSKDSESVLIDLLSDDSNKKHKDSILCIHRNLSIILRLISCTRKIDTLKFESLCKKTMLTIAKDFPWAKINHTLHGALQHSGELIQMNNNQGLGGYSEEGLEANNKDVRHFLEHLSRKSDSNQQLTDVHHRILERSDPFLIFLTSKYRQTKQCSLCKQSGHTIRTHDKHFLNQICDLEDYFLD